MQIIRAQPAGNHAGWVEAGRAGEGRGLSCPTPPQRSSPGGDARLAAIGCECHEYDICSGKRIVRGCGQRKTPGVEAHDTQPMRERAGGHPPTSVLKSLYQRRLW